MSNASAVFWKGLPRIGGTCAVPEVVYDEVVSVYGRQLEETWRKLMLAERNWCRFTGQAAARPDHAAHHETAEAYSRFLQEHFRVHQVTLLPYPDVSHRQLVRRAITRCKPFTESGAGYRDALIWSTLRQLRASTVGEVCFVTSNSKDFGTAPELHPDLVAELTGGEIALYNKLEEFNTARIVPSLERLDEVLRQLQVNENPKFSLTSWIDSSLREVLNDAQHGCDFVGLEPDHGSVWISKLKASKNLIVDDVRLLPSGDLLVLANVDLVVEVAVSASWEDCDRYRDVREFFNGDCFDSPTAYVEGEGNVAFTMTLKNEGSVADSCAIDAVHSESYVDVNPHPRRDA